MEKGSPGVSNKIGPLAYDEYRRYKGVQQKLRFLQFLGFLPKLRKIRKISVLLKLIKASVTGGRRVSSKNCDFSKNCGKIGEIAVFANIKVAEHSFAGGQR